MTQAAVIPEQPVESIETTGAAAEEMAAPRGRLTRRVIHASMWTIGGYAGAQALRLISNLILTRLLLPEHFGLMLIVMVFLQGLQMFSDIGLSPAVVKSDHGDDPVFLNTAWTMQVIRGALLWAAATALAWPAALIYGEEQLTELLALVALAALIQGFRSTSVITLQRRLEMKRLTVLDLWTQGVALVVTVGLALWLRSVWALALGALAREAAQTVASYFLLRDHRDRFRFHWPFALEIFHFGKWILLSSILYFLSSQGDRVLLAKYVEAEVLGVFAIAVFLSEALGSLILKLAHSVLYPGFSQVARDDLARLRSVYARSRFGLDALSMLGCGALFTAGAAVVQTLYDPRYEAAGWMLQVLAVRVGLSSLAAPAETCLFSLGHTKYGFIRSAVRAVALFGGVPIGWMAGGLNGALWAIALSELPPLLVLLWGVWRAGMLSVWVEMRAMLLFLAGAVAGAGAAWAWTALVLT